MKILKLHFKNLNSLVGEWKIDFTSAEYSEQGIFAITGPTGAGKSTILDAICLALFGRTPRLDKINTSQNEIMSRQCGECFASLEFQTANGHYRAWWTQSRARKKADGKLQNAQHVLEDLSASKIIEDKLSKIPQAVIDITGMDFEHFTRAMLLAQGGFAKFLQSSADERSPILEKVTGTEIYTKISQLVHERKNSEEQQLNLLNAELSGIRILADEETLLLQTELTHLETQLNELSQQKNNLDEQQRWLTNLDKLRNELQKLTLTQQELQQRENDFNLDAERLKIAKNADEIYSDIYVDLLNIRKQLADLQSSIINNQQQLPEVNANISKQQDVVTNLSTELTTSKTDYAQQQKLWQEVRLLDADITTQKQRIHEHDIKLKHNQNEKAKLIQNHEQLTVEESTKQEQAEIVNKYLQQYSVDAQLIGDYSGLCAKLDRFGALYLQTNELHNKHDNYQDRIKSLTQKNSETNQDSDDLNREFNLLTEQVIELEQQAKQIANDKTIIMLQNEVLQLTKTQANYRTLSQNLAEQDELHQQLASVNMQIQAEEDKIKHDVPELEQTNELIVATTQLVNNLREQELLQSKITSLSDEREKLQANQPCPLCGALEHPYAHDVPVISNLATQIFAAESRIKALQNKLIELNSNVATSKANLAKLDEQSTILSSRQTILIEQMNQQLTLLNLSNTPNLGDKLSENIVQIDEQITQIHVQIVKLEEVERNLLSIQNTRGEIEHKLAKLKLYLTEIATQKSALESQLTEINHSLLEITRHYEELRAELSVRLAPYAVMELAYVNIDAIKQQLLQRLNAWQDKQKTAEQIKQDIQQIRNEIQQNTQVELTITKQIDEQQQELNLLRMRYDEIWQKRQQLFADNDVVRAEQEWQQRLSVLENKMKLEEQRFQQLQQRQITLNSMIVRELAQLTPLQSSRDESEQTFNLRLIKMQFADEQDFNAKRLTRDEIKQLQAQQDNLRQEQVAVTSRIEQIQEQLLHEESLQISTQTSDELQSALNVLQGNYDSCNQRIGEVRGQLVANAQAREEQQETITKRDKQLQITERYRRLHVLIGSSDGKKFRNFAQGLTFELVVKHANQQLRQMSDRYLLIRDNDAPLELNVIDNYQGGEIRTTKNLSGGESFVISLALALGLSKLSSNKVQVDSLFLDEGFGTLDEDALQTALDALDSLQRYGKLIGVISHVGALKERISLQIQVEPLSGGVSKISGVGCSGK